MLKRVCAIGCGLLMVLTSTGCQRSSAGLPSRPAAEIPIMAPGTPEDVTRTVLLTLQAWLRAAANSDEEAEKKAEAQVRELATDKELKRGLERMPQYKALLTDVPMEGYIDNWAAIVSYYAEGYHLDRMTRAFESTSRVNDNPVEVHVVVPATGPQDEARIQVNCVYDEKTDRWYVSRIGFVGRETEAAAATSQPASSPQPASAPQPAAPTTQSVNS